MIQISFPDGAVRSYPPGSTAMDIAKSISEGLAKKVLAAKVDGVVIDATRPIESDASLQLLTWQDTDGGGGIVSRRTVLGRTGSGQWFLL
jgi:threonyl-tRNA synthetase